MGRTGMVCACAVMATLAVLPAAAAAQDGLVAGYSFDEGFGGTVSDASGRGNAGTASGTTWAPGRNGQALSFSGANGSYVTVPDSASLRLSGALTLEAWVNPGAIGGSAWRTVLFKQLGTAAMGYALYANNGAARPTGQVNIGGEQNTVGTTQLALNAWTHLATTYDGATQRFYVNGTQVASRAQTGALATATGPLRIGGNGVWGEYFRGLIDDVRIYNRALGAAEVQADMATPVGGTAPQPVPEPEPEPEPDDPPRFVNDRVIISLDEPTALKFTPDGRLLIGERDGTIWVVPAGATRVDPQPLLQVASVLTDNERGLLGLVLDPSFATNGHFYVYYTHGSQRNRVSRFTVGSTAETVIWQNTDPADIWHQGGDLAFGPDGHLYVSVGDQLDGPSAQSLSSANGKILRITRDGAAPTDNPFYDGTGPNVDAIWARGLRNPFRFSIDPASGRLLIGDVGQGTWEEINLGVRGANYGWPTCEGSCSNGGMTNPIHAYGHINHDASVTGGFVYRGTQFPSEYRGDYFFADYAQNWIRRLTIDGAGNVTAVRNFEPADGALDGPYGDIVALTEGPDGSLWYVDAGPFQSNSAGAVRRIRNVNANQPPTAQIAADDDSGPAPHSVRFTSTGSADPEGQPITYAWDFGDGESSTAATPEHVFAASGRYTVRLTVSDGTLSTVSEPVMVTVGSPPTATILSPAPGRTFRAGETIAFSGTGSDADDPGAPALSWKVVFHHDSHIHPVLDAAGPSGSLTVPDSGHSFAGDTSLELVLTATDSDGIQTETSMMLEPEKARLALATAPQGLALTVDGMAAPAPYDELVGFRRAIEAPSPQFLPAGRFDFSGWSDGGAAAHTVTVAPTGTELTATFTQATSAPSGLVAAYAFDEGNGATLYDASGNGHDGTLTGPIWSGSGPQRRRPVLRRRQRLRADRRPRRPRSDDRHDARGLGAAERARLGVADRALQGAADAS